VAVLVPEVVVVVAEAADVEVGSQKLEESSLPGCEIPTS